MQSHKDKLMQDLEKYKPKAEVEFGKKKKATAQGERVSHLAQTFTDNFPGKFKNGRPLISTEFDRLAVTQITTPLVKSPRNALASKTAMSKSHFNKTSMSKFGKDTTETAWKTTLSPQEVVTQRNLF
jgi:hypothetical protein